MIWVGDLNSAANTITGVPPGVPPDTTTYSTVIAAGFHDSWTATRLGDPGYTCCEAENLLNPTPLLNQRIDYVLTRVGTEPNGIEGKITPLFDSWSATPCSSETSTGDGHQITPASSRS